MGLKLRAPGAEVVIEEAEVRRALAALADPRHAVEIMVALDSGAWVRRPIPTADPGQAVAAVNQLASGAKGVYWSLNPVSPALTRNMRVSDALERRWLLVDLDPVREPGTNATEEEHELARARACAVHEELSAHGWPAPVIIDSGNGFHLLYRVSLPNDLGSRILIRRSLDALARLYGSPEVLLDTAVFAANAHSKLPGTMARKGPHSAERPHRWCRLVSVPETIDVVDVALLRELAGPTPPPRPAKWSLSLRVSARGAQAYGKAALDREIGRIDLAGQAGQMRNVALNRAAYALFQLVAGGVLREAEVVQALESAAERAGLPASEYRATIASARAAGVQEPRGVPERPSPLSAGCAADKTEDPQGRIIVRGSEITPRIVEWLWPGRIPLGKLTTFAGIGGLGKTFVLCDVAARVTRGLPWPDGGQTGQSVGSVVFVSGEDDADDTLVPRLLEAEADVSRVAFLRTEVLDQFTLHDLKTLDKAVEQTGDVRMVAIDPPTAYLGGTDDHKNGELRALLSPLKSWAAKRRVALIFNTHVNKGTGQKVEAMMRVMGSVAWVNTVRAAHMFARDPDNPERRLFVGMKLNIGKERKGLAYRIVETGALARVEWLGEVDVTADQAINRDVGKSRRVIASEWLVERFAEKLEWPSDELIERGKQDGVSRNAIFEAKTKLDLPRARQVIQPNGDRVFVWWVPEDWKYFDPSDQEEERF